MSINVVVFNSSPNEDHGNTQKVLNPIIEGMKNSGANVDVYYTHRMHIEKCRGCTENINFESTGKCIVVDDMQYIYPKMKKADLWVFASPNYEKVINNSLIRLFDRLEPLFETYPTFVNGNGNTNAKKGKILLVSVSTEFGNEGFEKLIEQVKSLSDMFNREFIGSVLRSSSWVLSENGIVPDSIEQLYKTLKKAGEEITQTGKLSKTILKEVNKELINRKSFLANIFSEMN